MQRFISVAPGKLVDPDAVVAITSNGEGDSYLWLTHMQNFLKVRSVKPEQIARQIEKALADEEKM